jgi:hypothetical protein
LWQLILDVQSNRLVCMQHIVASRLQVVIEYKMPKLLRFVCTHTQDGQGGW